MKNTKQYRAKKRAEAELRQAEYNKLTLDQKLAKAKPGSREHTRLMAQKAEARK